MIMRLHRGVALLSFSAALLVAGVTQAQSSSSGKGVGVRKHTHHGGTRAKGIDVSEWESPIQGRPSVDFAAVKRAGYSFCFTRVSDGQFHVDQSFDSYYPAIKRNKLIRGAYQFFRPEQDATAQADLLCRMVSQIKPGDLPPVLDVEVMDGVSSSRMGDQIRTWVGVVKARLGIRPMIYTAPGLWDGYGVSFGGYDLWVADYGPSTPALPHGWSKWEIFQYTDNENVPGVGSCDANLFNGTVADLMNYVGLGKKPKTTTKTQPK
jgi:lysozyme